MSPPLAYKPMIEIDGVKAFYLPRGYYAELELDPSTYHIKFDWKALHGVSDRELDILLEPGKETYVSVNNSLDLSMIAYGAASISSAISTENSIDLSDSRKVIRFHPQ